MPITFETLDENDNEVTLTVATVKDVCGTCGGEGTSCAHLGAFTSEDFDREGEDFREAYFRGDYDRACPECKGLRVVDVPDESRTDPKVWEKFIDHCESIRETDQMREMERRMGA